jgi:hypothetical protein
MSSRPTWLHRKYSLGYTARCCLIKAEKIKFLDGIMAFGYVKKREDFIC